MMTHSERLPARFPLNALSALIILAVSPFNPAIASHSITQELMHARSIDIGEIAKDDELNGSLADYFASEKLDGIRAIWTGNELVTRQGNQINAPTWFVEALPRDIRLEGELWIAHQQFQRLSSIVRSKTPNSKAWQDVKLMVFDSPSLNTPFNQRWKTIEALVESLEIPFLQLVPQHQVGDFQQLEHLLESIELSGGEGIMLHHKDSLYLPGKSRDLIKVKPYQDAEAIVIGYEPGKGKYSGQMGALWVITPENTKFKIGTGFSDSYRQAPPSLGAIIQYRYNGYTDSGIPRFARFLRERPGPEI